MAVTLYKDKGREFFSVYVQARGKKDNSIRIQKKLTKIETMAEARKLEKKLYRQVHEQVLKLEGKGLKWIDIIDRWATSARLGYLGDKYSHGYQIKEHTNRLKRYTKDWLNIQAADIGRGEGRRVLNSAEQLDISQSLVRSIKSSINTVYKWGIEERLIVGPFNTPVEGLSLKRKVEKVVKVLSLEEVRLLLNTARDINHPWFYIWSFAFLTGMRSGELMALEWDDIDFEKEVIRVSKSYKRCQRILKSTKSGAWRVVPISTELMALIQELQLARDSGVDFVLTRHHAWENGEAAKVLRQYLGSIGIDRPMSFHSLRACFATHMLASGVDQATVMKIGGWQDLKTFQIYVRLAGVDVKGATDAIKVFDSRPFN